ncbi:MAG TPA: adenylate/guanylate cyclase domain-containing protein [Solirubrobacterales bacterium]|nr:adenylate/guanylate cyclase domain-containing protein [Solirubrobacterales bacterium]
MTVTATTTDDGERKQVTVLFADVSGSMDLAEQQDPEEWRKIMQRFFSILADAVVKFEGTVDKFTGDGIMAVFGAPVAHEDHARRACYAALQMLDDVSDYAAELRRGPGLNFSTRIGINSGEVVAGAIGAGEEGEYTAIGHTVGLAQRMEALAEPGRAYLTESTAELAHGFMVLKDLGQFEIKGASQPVGVFELAGVGSARSRLDLSRERGFSTFVGRDEEMAVLDQALAEAERGEGAAVGIVAEPGIGKSRLCHEFAERCRERSVEVFECQAQAHARSIPFMPVLQMLRSYFGIVDGDPERIVREKIAGRTLLLDPGFADELPLLFDFLGVPDPERPLPQLSAEARHRALRGAVCRLVRAPNRRQTMVALVEDLHWMDEGSATLLGELISSVEGTQTLAIVNFRPEYDAEWAGAPTYRGISLEPLGPDDTREMLRDLAGEDPSLDGLGELIHERTAGNPFFIEEIVRTLAEAGNLEGERGDYRLARPVEEVVVPASVQTVLAARIDRLSPTAKRLLQAASVTSKEVSERALGMVSGLSGSDDYNAALAELIAGGFLYEAELYPERVFAFRHPLTREVAYGTQLADQRAVTHTATARVLIELNPPDRHDELSALIASHMEAGGETLEAARWSARAAYWAGSSRPGDAMRLWRKVMELSDQLEESEETTALAVMSRLLQLDFAWRLGMDSGEEERLRSDAERIATRTGDRRSLALLKLAIESRPGLPHEADTWLEAVAETNRLADESGDLHLRIAMRAAGSYAYLCTADFDRFEQTLDETIELCGENRQAGAGIVIGNPFAWSIMAKGLARRERGDLEQAEALFNEGLRIATEEGDPEVASWTRSNQALMLAQRGEPEAGVALARRNCELTERLGDVFSRSLALSNLGASQLAAGEAETALASLEEAERIYRSAIPGGDEMECWRAGLRAEALTAVGRAEEAVALAEWASEVARERGMLWSLPLALQALGVARSAAGQDGAIEALDEAAKVAEGTGAMVSVESIAVAREMVGASAR